MLWGGLGCLGGIIATVGTLLMSRENNGQYMVLTGPMVVGGSYFLRGLYGYMHRK